MHKCVLKRRLLATREEAAQIYYVDKAIDELADRWTGNGHRPQTIYIIEPLR